jgi:hypothetical protein
VLNRPIASDNFSYSPALRPKQKLGPWTPDLLSESLSDPFKFATGTNMLPLKMSPEDINDIVSTLVRAWNLLLMPQPHNDRPNERQPDSQVSTWNHLHDTTRLALPPDACCFGT